MQSLWHCWATRAAPGRDAAIVSTSEIQVNCQAPQGRLTFEDSPVILRREDQGPALSMCPGDNV